MDKLSCVCMILTAPALFCMAGSVFKSFTAGIAGEQTNNMRAVEKTAPQLRRRIYRGDSIGNLGRGGVSGVPSLRG
ncbi:MAG: hypothetical protein LBL45_09465 [Treponema sp.]|nr:hypothetical protein [Treponema sp.]